LLKPKGSIDARQHAAAFVTQRTLSLNDWEAGCGQDVQMPFEDTYFPTSCALGSSDLEEKIHRSIVWQRALVSGASLFGGGIEPEDVLEGELDDCYLVAALTLLAGSPSMVRNLFNLEKSNESEGKHCVCIWQQGKKIEVEVDDRIPCHVTSRQPIFARCQNAAGFWVQMVEKAFAKLYGRERERQRKRESERKKDREIKKRERETDRERENKGKRTSVHVRGRGAASEREMKGARE